MITVIITTRPKPAFGRQGLGGVSLCASGAQLGRGMWSFFVTQKHCIIIYIYVSPSSSSIVLIWEKKHLFRVLYFLAFRSFQLKAFLVWSVKGFRLLMWSLGAFNNYFPCIIRLFLAWWGTTNRQSFVILVFGGFPNSTTYTVRLLFPLCSTNPRRTSNWLSSPL